MSVFSDWTFWVAPGITVLTAAVFGWWRARRHDEKHDFVPINLEPPLPPSSDEAARRLWLMCEAYRTRGLEGVLSEDYKDW